MKFVLEVELDGADWNEGTTVQELSRILRYWGGNLHHYDLSPGDGSTVYDSGYREVGHWTVAPE